MIDKKLLSILIFFLLFTTFKECYTQNKKSIAVIDLDAEGISESAARIISSRLRIDLFNTGKFTVLEREKMDEILKEQGFQLSGCTSNECVVEVGRLTGVEQMVAGNIGKIGGLITVNLRLIDVETGRILKTATEDCECSLKMVVTYSIKNVAQILAGEKVSTKYYNKTFEHTSLNESDKNKLTEWETVGITKNEYIILLRIGISKNKIIAYFNNGLTTTDLLELKKSRLSEYFWIDYKRSGLTIEQYIKKLKTENSLSISDILLPVGIVTSAILLVLVILRN